MPPPLGTVCPRRQLIALPLRPDQMNAHRHMHNSSSQGMQSFHKDSQRGKPPNHLPRSLFVFYVRSSRLSIPWVLFADPPAGLLVPVRRRLFGRDGAHGDRPYVAIPRRGRSGLVRRQREPDQPRADNRLDAAHLARQSACGGHLAPRDDPPRLREAER